MGHLGSGQFGNVEKGTWQNKEVALKTLKTGSIDEDKVKFLQEAAIMAQFRHPNIVTLHGVVSDKEPVSRPHIIASWTAHRTLAIIKHPIPFTVNVSCGANAPRRPEGPSAFTKT